LLGGSRVHDLIERLRGYPTLKDFAAKRGWDFGEGYIAGLKGISRPAGHLIGQPLLPTEALSEAGIDALAIELVPDRPIKDTKSAARFTPPFLLIKENEDLHHGLWNGSYLTYKHRILGSAADQNAVDQLAAIEAWLSRESTILKRMLLALALACLFSERPRSLELISSAFPIRRMKIWISVRMSGSLPRISLFTDAISFGWDSCAGNANGVSRSARCL